MYGSIVVFLSPLGAFRHAEQALQHAVLQFAGMFGVLFDFFQTGGEIDLIQKLCNIHRSY